VDSPNLGASLAFALEPPAGNTSPDVVLNAGGFDFMSLRKSQPRNLNERSETARPPAPVNDGCAAPTDNASGEHWRYCPQCGHELINEKCKLRCPRCHYFMSCSDFDFAG
jgi:hypothetical protein